MTILCCAWLYLVASAAFMLALKCWARATGRACKPLFAWFHIWVGVFYDQGKHRLYIFPLPMLGIFVDLAPVNTLVFTRSWDGFDVRTWRTDYWVNRQRVAQWYELTEGQHGISTMLALRTHHPAVTAKRAVKLWDERKAA